MNRENQADLVTRVNVASQVDEVKLGPQVNVESQVDLDPQVQMVQEVPPV